VFGSIGYSHIPQEPRKKLEVRAQRVHVVAYLGVSKGWRLWILDKNKFIKSAMVCFLEELKNVPTTPLKPNRTPPKPIQANPGVASQPNKVSEIVMPAHKMSLTHIMNLMKLGDFTHGVEFHDQ
jgi:hypothetical protein